MDTQARPVTGRRTPISERAGVVVEETATREHPADPLAGALPEWDLLPGTQFLRRR